VEDWNWEIIVYGHCRAIFDNCDVIVSKAIEFGEKNAK